MALTRALALQVLLKGHRSRAYPDQILREMLDRYPDLSLRDRALVYQLVLGVLRWQGKIDWIIRQVSLRPLEKLSLKTLTILRLGVFQLLFLSRIPPSAAVNESVNLAKNGEEWSTGFINGVLRSILRRKGTFPFPSPEDPIPYLAVNYSHPVWLVEEWLRIWGFEKTREFCQANLEIPPSTLRVNTLKIGRDVLLPKLRRLASQTEAAAYSPEGVRMISPLKPLQQTEFFKEGLFQIQDEASQLISFILDPQPGERILDLCAGFGGKASHLAQLMKNRGIIRAVDHNPRKLKDLMKNVHRLGVSIIRGWVGDAAGEDLFPKDSPPFDRILLDAPCTGWGVIRRNPDLKWRLTDEDSPRLADQQNKFLQKAAKWLKSKGVLVYATCTLSPTENEHVVARFLEEHLDFSLEDVSSFLPGKAKGLADGQGFYRTWPPLHGTDGFFAARMIKSG